ncbi:hypothetical protein E2C01_073607 [Portunus trituberculatus]|uniref:Uncharacterized protein n=1 Tax=Portunus trituberculatus TaxID=210409 RepID=A0A5B7IED3_PORTR|nr:hypothetical protein [Portunus trituberculatus]
MVVVVAAVQHGERAALEWMAVVVAVCRAVKDVAAIRKRTHANLGEDLYIIEVKDSRAACNIPK